MSTPARRKTFLSDAVDLLSLGAQSLEGDSFSECFRPLNQQKLYKSGIFYIFSFVTRYCVLLPFRLALLLAAIAVWAVCFFYGIYTANESAVMFSFTLFFRMSVVVFNCHITHHGSKQRILEPHVYVANHTSFIDFMILSSYRFCHACIAENHGGLFGFLFNTILSKNGSITFKRSEKADRESAIARVREHIKQNKAPMLIFPEGTVVNNEYMVLFQKGAFELGTIVCPVGIRYRKKWFDPYWNRRAGSFTMHLFYLITRWRIDADVFWLSPVTRKTDETAIEFSHRVQNIIAYSTGLKNTIWNGYFKSSPVIKDRVLFRIAFLHTYLKYGSKATRLGVDEEDAPFYLFDENIYCPKSDRRLYFGEVSYDSFMRECCKEYLKLKGSTRLSARETIAIPLLQSESRTRLK